MESLISLRDIPLKDNSAMDGYALRFSDLEKCDKLKVKGVIAAGADTAGLIVRAGECYKIMTGAHMPEGADTVVPWENTDNGNNEVAINTKSDKGAHIRLSKEDVAKGDVLDFRGRRISPFILSRLASCGILSVTVSRRPRIAVISTGNEVASLKNYDAQSKLLDSNSPVVIGLLQEFADCSYLGVIEDSEEAVIDILQKTKGFDMVNISGGISKGDFDFVAKAGDKAGARWLFHGVHQKPGKPLAFGFIGDTPIFSLPGNPVACAFCSYFYVLSAVKKICGMTDYAPSFIKAVSEEEANNKNDRIQFNRVKLKNQEGVYHAYPYHSQNSNLIGSMTDCDAFMEVDGVIKKGESAKVYTFNM